MFLISSRSYITIIFQLQYTNSIHCNLNDQNFKASKDSKNIPHNLKNQVKNDQLDTQTFHPYPILLISGRKIVGYNHLIEENVKNLEDFTDQIQRDKALEILEKDIDKFFNRAKEVFESFIEKPIFIQRALIELMFLIDTSKINQLKDVNVQSNFD